MTTLNSRLNLKSKSKLGLFINLKIGASQASKSDSKSWDILPWKKIRQEVFRLQVRIAKATREGKIGRVKALQRILTSSFYAKCLAVKRVTSNKGAKTPGIDDILWRTNLQKISAVYQLKRRGYKPLPLKRIYIAKKQKGKFRPLSIPTMGDRSMQALWHLALEPIAEERADLNAYGFRPKRSAKDAIEQCFYVLSSKTSTQWIFEGDISSCFDRISHEWLLKNIPMDKVILRKFLKAGFIEKKAFYKTELGVPQGSIIGPTITLMVLSGLEEKLKSLFRTRKTKVNLISYADDFIITATSKELLEESIIPFTESFLSSVGLEISKEKSKITHIEEGFDFLGFNVRKYSGKLLIKPSKGSINKFLSEIRKTIKSYKTIKTEDLIKLLNPKILGWANYFRSVVSSKVFHYIDWNIYTALWRWMLRRHPHQSRYWIKKKYLRKYKLCNTMFHAMIKDKDKTIPLYLCRMMDIGVRRHIKIRMNANPYNPEFKEYFKCRDASSKNLIPKGVRILKLANELPLLGS